MHGNCSAVKCMKWNYKVRISILDGKQTYLKLMKWNVCISHKHQKCKLTKVIKFLMLELSHIEKVGSAQILTQLFHRGGGWGKTRLTTVLRNGVISPFGHCAKADAPPGAPPDGWGRCAGPDDVRKTTRGRNSFCFFLFFFLINVNGRPADIHARTGNTLWRFRGGSRTNHVLIGNALQKDIMQFRATVNDIWSRALRKPIHLTFENSLN